MFKIQELTKENLTLASVKYKLREVLISPFTLCERVGPCVVTVVACLAQETKSLAKSENLDFYVSFSQPKSMLKMLVISIARVQIQLMLS